MLNKNQKLVVECTDRYVVVDSPAASGKTKTISERVKWLLNKYPNKKILCITFTNNAADEMKERINVKNENLIISTLHSYCTKLLLKNNYHPTNVMKWIDNQQFDKLIDAVITHPEFTEHIDYVIADEAQDFSGFEFNLIIKVIKPDNWMFLGDFRQSIYGFKGSDPDYFIDLERNPNVSTFYLNENYRNAKEIFEYSKRFLDLYDNLIENTILHNSDFGIVESIKSTSINIPNLLSYYESDEKWGDWAILTRSNRDLDDIVYALTKSAIPCITFKQGDLSNEDIKNALNSDKVKVLTVHSAKGLEFEKVMVFGLPTKVCKNDEERRVQYVAATRAKSELYWVQKKSISKRKKFYGGMKTFGEV